MKSSIEDLLQQLVVATRDQVQHITMLKDELGHAHGSKVHRIHAPRRQQGRRHASADELRCHAHPIACTSLRHLHHHRAPPMLLHFAGVRRWLRRHFLAAPPAAGYLTALSSYIALKYPDLVGTFDGTDPAPTAPPTTASDDVAAATYHSAMATWTHNNIIQLYGAVAMTVNKAVGVREGRACMRLM